MHAVCMAEPQTAELCSATEPQTAVMLRADFSQFFVSAMADWARRASFITREGSVISFSPRPRTPGRGFSGQGCTPGSRVGPLGKQQRFPSRCAPRCSITRETPTRGKLSVSLGLVPLRCAHQESRVVPPGPKKRYAFCKHQTHQIIAIFFSFVIGIYCYCVQEKHGMLPVFARFVHRV